MNLKTFLDFKYEIENNEAVIYKYIGDLEEVTIPDSIEGFPVTYINASLVADTGFSNSDTLKKVVIPEGVKKIAMYSFRFGCKSLETVVIPASVTDMVRSAFGSESLKAIEVDKNNPNFSSVDGVLFNKDKTELICFPRGKSYRTGGDIPEGMMEIYGYDIPDGTQSVGNDAFGDCWLNSIIIPGSVTTISGRAFSGCRFLKSISLPDGIAEIDWDVFEGCVELESITLPDSVTKIDNRAFKGCAALEGITIPTGVTEIRFDAFNGCAALTSMTIPEGVKKIEQRTFADCVSLERISIPASMTKIDLSAFDGCKALACIVVDDGNSVYASENGALFWREGNKRIYTPRALLLKTKSKITSLADIVGMTDEELLKEISAELGFEYDLAPDNGWECADSMREWHERRLFGECMKIYAFTADDHITKLTFSGLDVDQLPLAVAGLSALTVLDVSHTKITELPEWLDTLSALEVLNVYGSDVAALPDTIGNLTTIKELHIGASDITELPDALCKLTNLEVLHLNHTAINKLPEDLGNCTALRSINLHGSKITALPESIGDLASLEYLYSYYMPLKALPESIGNLAALKRLWICQTHVSELPDSICNLTALQDINYKPGRIEKLPKVLEDILAANNSGLDKHEEDDKGKDKRVKNVMSITVYGNEWQEDE